MSEIESLYRQLEQLRQENDDLRVELAAQQTQQVCEQAENDKVASRFSHLLELMPAGVVLIDNRGRVSMCNPAAEQFLGTPLKKQYWSDVIERSFAPQSDDGFEISLKDGRRVKLITCALTAEPGQLLMLTDLTETRLLQSRVSHYQRLSEMGRMVASLAHQVRTPLSAASLYMDHLSRSDLREDQRLRFVGKVRDRLHHLEQQVRDMLLFARGETRLEDRISSGTLVRALEDQLDMPLAYHEGDFEIVNRAADCQLQCNKETLLGAIMNLINNALQAGGATVNIQVLLESVDGQLQISIGDNGPGMDKATRLRALEPFYTTKSHGTGLGLAVAQVVANAHHGSFSLNSEQGVGTLVTLSLPIYQTETA